MSVRLYAPFTYMHESEETNTPESALGCHLKWKNSRPDVTYVLNCCEQKFTWESEHTQHDCCELSVSHNLVLFKAQLT